MVDFFDKVYSVIESKNKIIDSLKLYSACRFILRQLINIIAPGMFIVTSWNKRYSLNHNLLKKETEIKTIVSLTSFPARIERLWIVIETILRQTKKPDKIILWLSKKQFSSEQALPIHLLHQVKRGLEIRFVNDDISSHKKYFYALKEFPNDYLLTIDDDMFYRSTMIEDLLQYSKRFPGAIISQYSKKIKWINNKLQKYSSWSRNKGEVLPEKVSFFGSGGGTLFPPGSLFKDVLDVEIFMRITPTADDIWLNTMARLNNTNIVTTKYYSQLLPVIHKSKVKLHTVNNLEFQNDFYIEKIRTHYKEKLLIDPYKQKMDE